MAQTISLYICVKWKCNSVVCINLCGEPLVNQRQLHKYGDQKYLAITTVQIIHSMIVPYIPVSMSSQLLLIQLAAQ